MKSSTVPRALAAAALLLASSPALAAEAYTIDPDHSAILFKVHHFGAGYVWGRFRDVKGTIQYDAKKPAKSSVQVEIATASIYTANKKRDTHLKSPDFFNAKKYPKITFRSTKVKRAGKGRYKVTGKLTLHGVTKTVTLTVKETGAAVDAWKNFRRGFEGELVIKRSDFGMKKMIGPAADKVHLIFAIEGIRKKSA